MFGTLGNSYWTIWGQDQLCMHIMRYRVTIHLVDGLGSQELSAFRRDLLQDLLDVKTKAGLSFSTVDHLRWDLKQIFDLAVARLYRS